MSLFFAYAYGSNAKLAIFESRFSIEKGLREHIWFDFNRLKQIFQKIKTNERFFAILPL